MITEVLPLGGHGYFCHGYMDMVIQAVQDFAERAHRGQVRKFAQEPYIAHPIRVMGLCRMQTADVAILCAALLHDVLEDTAVGKEELLEFLLGIMPESMARRTLGLVVELTDVYTKQQYPQWNRRKRKAMETQRLKETSADSQTVKYADIIDNCAEIAHQDTEDFGLVFLRECRALLKQLTRGNAPLYRQAVATVDEGIRYLTGGNQKSRSQ